MFSELCNPAKIYFVFALIVIVLDIVSMFDTQAFNLYTILGLGITAILHYAWLMLLQYFCNKNMEGAAWFILFFPFILMILVFFLFGVSFIYIFSTYNFNFNTTLTPTILPTLLKTIAPTTRVTALPTTLPITSMP